MYLKKMTITNFRKFGSEDNVIEFVDTMVGGFSEL